MIQFEPSMKTILPTLLICLFTLPYTLSASEPMTATDRFIPGAEKPEATLRYKQPNVRKVEVAGSWSMWEERIPLLKRGNEWTLDVRTLKFPRPGRYEFKFIVEDVWETGENRSFHINENNMMERPPDIILSAVCDSPEKISVFLKKQITSRDGIKISMDPDWPIADWKVLASQDNTHLQGYSIAGRQIRFIFSEKIYGKNIPKTAKVVVAGNFNGWDNGGRGGQWQLRDDDDDGVWEVGADFSSLKPAAGERGLQFKFVINENDWLNMPDNAPNPADDGRGHTNLGIDPTSSGTTALEIYLAEPLPMSEVYTVVVEGLAEKKVLKTATPGDYFYRIYSDKEMGPILHREHDAITFRLFAPRAKSVTLNLYNQPSNKIPSKLRTKYIDPNKQYPMWMDAVDGVWEVSLLGQHLGEYFSYSIDGPQGDGEGFHAISPVGDPYSYAVSHENQNAIIIDTQATNEIFTGWTDQEFERIPMQDAVIYETHLRDLTIHPSSKVTRDKAGKYDGLIASTGTGTGLDHLKNIGINTIELLPLHEFNSEGAFNWGYVTCYFFSPEGSYAHDQQNGSQVYEFKNLVNYLHNQGFSVVMDVVFNHVGSPNIFSLIDRKYYFRLTPEFAYQNFSGVGNDVRSESAMMRRFIVECVKYWTEEYHIDGFRFDLCELIDMDTLLEIRDEVRDIDPNIMLISEPWSFRGEHKSKLRGTGWSAWNNDFRYASKDFVRGEPDKRDSLKEHIIGSVNSWASDPLQPVNYMESHDDMALTDELSTAPNNDARKLSKRDGELARLSATLIFTSLGIPMIAEGQEFLRSKWGIHNTYNKDDEVNALNWEDRNRPIAKETLAYYKAIIKLRRSEAGASFRLTERPDKSYYEWINPQDSRAFGYIVNAPKQHEGKGFIVLLNAAASKVNFTVNFPVGNWKKISDGDALNAEGLQSSPALTGGSTQRVTVPARHATIFMEGL